jgi:hypothetical protein
MKTKFNSIFALIGAIVIIALSACEKDQPIPEPTQPYKGTVELRFVPTMNGEAFQQNVNFVGPNNFRMNIETLKFYLSDIQLINSSYTTMLSEIELVDLVQNDKTISFETDPGTYQQLKFFLGVKKALNGTDNPDFPT